MTDPFSDDATAGDTLPVALKTPPSKIGTYSILSTPSNGGTMPLRFTNSPSDAMMFMDS